MVAITKATFREKVLHAVKQIPRGQVRSYQEIARKTASPRAARAVGSILKQNFDEHIPCHRVVRADGRLGNYNRGQEQKRKILQSEGVIIRGNRAVR